MTKKIAVLLVGGLKQFARNSEYDKESFSESWKRVVEYYDADVFACIDSNDFFYNDVQYFSDENIDKKVCNDDLARYHTNTKYVSYEDSKPMIESVLKNTFHERLKSTMITKYEENSERYLYSKYSDLYRKYFSVPNSMSQYDKWKKCFKLMEEYEKTDNIDYDIVIKTRPDVKLLNVLDVDIRKLDFKKKIYCSSQTYHLSDFWAMGDRLSMNIYCSFIDNIGINFAYDTFLFLFQNNGRSFDYEIATQSYPTKYKIKDAITYHNASGLEFQLDFWLRMINNIQLLSRVIICKCCRFYPGNQLVDIF
tara:strand:- start:1505 stop:2428 length:924 start_codon:yes stop_codon:yes gene_type:complete